MAGSLTCLPRWMIGWAALVPALAATPSSGATVPDKPQAATLVILGASYAKGWGTPALPGFARVINRGVGGDETGGMRQRFEADVVALKPDAVLIWGLVNNITRASAEDRPAAKERARNDYREMLRLARASGIEVILATEVPWTESQGVLDTLRAWIGALRGRQSYASRISADVHEVNDALRAMATADGIRLLDFAGVFAAADGTRKPEFAAEDGSHVSPAGYRALTDYAREVLSRTK